MEDEEPRRSIVFLGRDLTKIACLRNAFLYSISSYFGVSLLTFLFTSRPNFSSHVGFASCMAVASGYFINCRMNLARQKKELAEMLQMQEKHITTITTKSYLKGTEPLLSDASN